MAYRPKYRWTAKQVEFLTLNYATMKDETVAEHLGKTLKSIRRKRENLGLKKSCGRGIVSAAKPKVSLRETPLANS